MKPAFPVVCLLAVSAGSASGQSSTARMEFEAADIQATPSGASDSYTVIRAGRLEVKGGTLLQLIMTAYGFRYPLEGNRVIGGPAWLDRDRFDITTKARAGSSEEAIRAMLETLLADRFQLAVHPEQRPLPIYVLSLGKNLKIKESTPGAATECKGGRENDVVTYSCHNMTMSGLADSVRQRAGAYLDAPLVDRTGLKGEYDFTLKWTPKGLLKAATPGEAGNSSGISVFEALDKQLGLKVEKQSTPASVIVVDHVNRTPSDNPPGTMEKLPPPVTEFEVATIRPSRPGAEENFEMKNGRINATGLTLKDLISSAYDVDDDMVAGGEKWLDTEHFDVIAKTSPGTSFEALRTMLRTLLEQRFHLAAHQEDRPVPVYALTMPKKTSKLKEADADSRSTCKTSVENGLRTYTCQNTTMAQFAGKLRQIAPGYIDRPVVDLTGLTGAYDFAVSWTGAGRVRALTGKAPASQAPGDAPAAAEPSSAMTIFESIEKQLGLRLAAQKYPQAVIVIDHVERTPTEN